MYSLSLSKQEEHQPEVLALLSGFVGAHLPSQTHDDTSIVIVDDQVTAKGRRSIYLEEQIALDILHFVHAICPNKILFKDDELRRIWHTER